MFINVLSLSFCRNSFLDPLNFQIFLKMEPVGESWVGRVVVVSLRTFINILFCRNGSLGLGDFRIFLEMELVGEFFRVWGGWVSLRTFINVLSLSFLQERLLLLKIELVSKSWVGEVVVVSLKTLVNVLFCKNGSLRLEDSWILLEIELVGKSWVSRVVVVSKNVR